MKKYKGKRFFSLISAALCYLTLISSASAEEKILDFDSHIIFDSDSAMTVEETIKVSVEGKEIKRGLYRNVPSSIHHNIELGPRRFLQMKPFEIYREKWVE